MTPSGFEKRRCRNHPERQAACRCPACALDFCRECVTEHDERLLCARCIARIMAGSGDKPARLRWLVNVGLCAAGVLVAWTFFFLAGETANSILTPHHIRSQAGAHIWHAR